MSKSLKTLSRKPVQSIAVLISNYVKLMAIKHFNKIIQNLLSMSNYPVTNDRVTFNV